LLSDSKLEFSVYNSYIIDLNLNFPFEKML